MPKIGVSTHLRPMGPSVIADLDTLLIALYVELTDRIIPPDRAASAVDLGGRPWSATPSWSVWPWPKSCCAITTNTTGCGPHLPGRAPVSQAAVPARLQPPAARGRRPDGRRAQVAGRHTPATAELLRLLDGTPVSVAARGPPPGVPTLPAGPATAATPPPLLLLGQPAAAAHHSRRDRDRVRAGQSQTAGRTPGRGGHAGWVAANRPAPGTLLVGDKGFAGCDFQTALAELELGMVRPARTDEPDVASSPTGCDSGSRRSSGPSSTSWVWTVTAAASRPGCGRGWCSACSPQRRHLVQLADRRPDQALPGRLRPLTLPLPASKTTSTI